MTHQYRNLIIVGSQKCATTTLYYQLVQHPSIVGARRRDDSIEANLKETNYLCHPGARLDGYLRIFDSAFAARPKAFITLDASSSYSMWPKKQPICSLVQDRLADPQFVFIFRDPVDRFESAINYVGGLRQSFMNASLDQILDHPVGFQAMLTSNYVLQLMPYHRQFRKGRLALVNYKDLVESSVSVVSRICSLMNISMDGYSTVDQRMHANKTAQDVSSFPLLAIVPPSLKRSLTSVISPSLKALLLSSLSRIGMSEPIPKRLLTADERLRLYSKFSYITYLLHEEYDISVSWPDS
ncbi:sulfotransferase [Synechococcus sp. CBW1006]|uniref:sulfotransferase n=1 Tax=Synechococcus sp. CBW1006 TaxID=1353138 RepID=UPI0018CF5C75|nr:sulfotransferase [Synechococcus sp. CBW1006]QPN65923.1 sulfotransferase [Synechococcus sp. CBW1006]